MVRTSFLRSGAIAALTVLLSLLGRSPSAAADKRPSLRLEAVIEEAMAHNPELEAARQRAKAMAAVPPQVSALDDPTLSYEAWNAPQPLRVDRADNNIFRFSQKLPFPGKRRLAGEVAVHDAQSAAAAAKAVELDLVAAVKRAYYSLWQAYRRLDVLERDKALVQQFTRTVEQKYATEDAQQAEVLRAQVELTKSINQIQTERLSIDSAKAEIQALMSREDLESLGVPEDPPSPAMPIPADDILSAAIGERPEVAAQDAVIAGAEASVKLAERASYPDFEVSVGRFENPGERDGFGIMGSMTVPIFNREKYRAGVSEARAKLDSARAERRRLTDRIAKEIKQAHLRVNSAFLRYNLFLGAHIPQAEQALRVTESAYQSKAASFQDLLDTLRAIEAVHLEHIMAQAEFEDAYAELERASGAQLPRSNRRAGKAETPR